LYSISIRSIEIVSRALVGYGYMRRVNNVSLKNELITRSPALLFGAGLLGFVASVVLSAKATPKAMRILEERRQEGWYQPDEGGPHHYSRLEKLKDIAPVYIPTIGMVLLSTGMLLASDRIVRNRYASLLTLYSITERAAREWESSTKDNVSNKKFHSIKERVLAPQQPPTPEDFIEGHLLFWDPVSGRYFSARSVDTVRRIFKDINLMLISEDFVHLSELYYQLGMSHAKFADDIGWHINDAEIEPSFDSTFIDDIAYIQVNYPTRPRVGWV